MTDFTQDLFARRRNASDGNTRVVSEGRLWYDSVTNTMRVSDGHTPGGQIVTGQSGSYTLPTATSSVKGGVQLGANIIAAGASIDVLQPTRVSQLENDSNYLSGSVLAGYATETFVTTRGYITSSALASGNANVIAANSRIASIDANIGAYQIWANANIAGLSSNAGTQATSINSISANLGAYQNWANGRVTTLDANLGTATTNISNLVTQANANTTALLAGSVTTGPLTVDSRAGGYFANISGAAHASYGRQTWQFFSQPNPSGGPGSWILFPDGSTQTTAYPGSSTSLSTFDANLGTLTLGNVSTQANLGAYQTWANANASTQQTSINTINANVGAYQVWANGRITTLDANLGTATTNISNLVTQANANVAAYLTTYTGNIAAGNTSITSNLVVGQSGLFRGPYNESSTLSGVFVGNTGTAPGITPRVGFFNGNTQQNWQIDNNGGEFRWFVPGSTKLSLYSNGNLNVTGSLTLGGKRAVNGPAFSAYANATLQTITTGSQQKVLFQTEEFDTDNCYASSRFTPTVEGYYQLNAEVRLDGVSGTGEMMIVIWKNGAEHKRGTNQSGTQIASNFWAMTVSSLVYANGTTDYFEIYVQQGSGGNVTVTAVNSPNITWFNGAMVRGA
jgi:hypothetical protein